MSDPLPLTLTDEELVELTGYKRPSKQAEWLARNGFKFKLNRANRPRVDRQHYLARMGAPAPAEPARTEPDWSAMYRRRTASKLS